VGGKGYEWNQGQKRIGFNVREEKQNVCSFGVGRAANEEKTNSKFGQLGQKNYSRVPVRKRGGVQKVMYGEESVPAGAGMQSDESNRLRSVGGAGTSMGSDRQFQSRRGAA